LVTRAKIAVIAAAGVATAAAAGVLLSGAAAATSAGPTNRVVEVTVPRGIAANETADLEVQTGVLTRGAQVDVRTPSGRLIGTISPFAIRPGQPAGTYSFPLTRDEIRDGHVTVCLSVRLAGQPARAPTPAEIGQVTIALTRTVP
jgi:hypothetical protein